MKLLRIAFCFYLLLMGILVISQPGTVLAQDETPTEESIRIETKYPKLETVAGESIEFEMELWLIGELVGGEPREFDLVTTAPKDWLLFVTPVFPADREIRSVTLKPGFSVAEKIIIHAITPYWYVYEPGEYGITLELVSGELRGSIEVKVVVTARYGLILAPATESYSVSATAGRDNYFSIEVVNGGTGVIDNITLSSSKPQDWEIDFSLNNIDSLDTLDVETIDVNIKPPPEAIAGDYTITIKASGTQAGASDLELRVRVKTPTIWGWVGVGIIALVIAGMVYIFMRFSRR